MKLWRHLACLPFVLLVACGGGGKEAATVDSGAASTNAADSTAQAFSTQNSDSSALIGITPSGMQYSIPLWRNICQGLTTYQSTTQREICTSLSGQVDANIQQIEQVFSRAIASRANLPAMPADANAAATLEGIDANGNGARDDIEIVIAKTLFSVSDTTTNDLDMILDIVRDIQPTTAAKIIDHRAYYCKYRALSASARDRVSMQMLTMLITDTRARRTAFHNQLINASGSLGSEVCA